MTDRAKETVKLFGADIPKWKDCQVCKKKLVCEFNYSLQNYPYRCSKCLDKLVKEEEKIDRGFSFGVKTKKDVVALGYDKRTGRPVGITEKKQQVDLSDTYYHNVKNDPYGWKATGKKIKGHVNRNYGR